MNWFRKPSTVFALSAFILLPGIVAGSAWLSNWVADQVMSNHGQMVASLLLAANLWIALFLATVIGTLRYSIRVTLLDCLVVSSFLATAVVGSAIAGASVSAALNARGAIVAAAIGGMAAGAFLVSISFAGISLYTRSWRTFRTTWRGLLALPLVWGCLWPTFSLLELGADPTNLGSLYYQSIPQLALAIISAAIILNIAWDRMARWPIPGLLGALLALSICALTWIAWLYSNHYQIRRIRATVLSEILTGNSENPEWYGVAAKLGMMDQAIENAHHLAPSNEAIALLAISNNVESAATRSGLRSRAIDLCQQQPASAGLLTEKLDCFSSLLHAARAADPGDWTETVQNRLHSEWERLRTTKTPYPQQRYDVAQKLLATSSDAGGLSEVTLIWNEAMKEMASIQREEYRGPDADVTGELTFDIWDQILSVVPANTTLPTYQQAEKTLAHLDKENWRAVDTYSIDAYYGLLRAPRCHDAVAWLKTIPISTWKTIEHPFKEKDGQFAVPSACGLEFAAFVRSELTDTTDQGGYYRTKWYHAIADRVAESGDVQTAQSILNDAGQEVNADDLVSFCAGSIAANPKAALGFVNKLNKFAWPAGASEVETKVYRKLIEDNDVDQGILMEIRKSPNAGTLLAMAGSRLIADGHHTEGVRLLGEAQPLLREDWSNNDPTAAIIFARMGRCRFARLMLEGSGKGNKVAEAYSKVVDYCR